MKYATLLTVLLLAACESDQAKAERLAREEAVACLVVDSYRLVAPSGTAPTAEQSAACDVARRNRNRFMLGR